MCYLHLHLFSYAAFKCYLLTLNDCSISELSSSLEVSYRYAYLYQIFFGTLTFHFVSDDTTAESTVKKKREDLVDNKGKIYICFTKREST